MNLELDTVPVPRKLVEALRDATDVEWGNVAWMSDQAIALIHAASAVLGSADAAERPDEGGLKFCHVLMDSTDREQFPCGVLLPCPDHTPADVPVGEPLCRCGHAENMHPNGHCLWTEPATYHACSCPVFTPTAPSPSTREPVPTQLTDEERHLFRCECVRLDDVWQHKRFCPVPIAESILAARLSDSTDARNECQETCCIQRRALQKIGQRFMDAIRREEA